MPKPDRELRTILYEAIRAKQRAGELTENDFELEITHRPVAALQDVQARAKVWIVGLAADDRVASRDGGFTREVPVQIAIQKLLIDGGAQNKTAEIDRYEDLEDDFRRRCPPGRGRYALRLAAQRGDARRKRDPVQFSGAAGEQHLRGIFYRLLQGRIEVSQSCRVTRAGRKSANE